ncbi:hypothetical protein EV702DRAFT_1051472 [Suillus placidus]|uniref:Retrovirus-related Pol polyprotein from transposon TNT 1-94-like beta-barrel domain-containing protein n=1 Tax=Suillus placidus TaxID=48579 RepID=A0A9P6ZGP2_9AGAM|nr:hypothetical protein EV702DRAFT_1051472 [Suillus placidus]
MYAIYLRVLTRLQRAEVSPTMMVWLAGVLRKLATDVYSKRDMKIELTELELKNGEGSMREGVRILFSQSLKSFRGTEKDPNDHRIVDSGASANMSRRLWFKFFRALVPAESVKIGDGRTIEVHGIGRMEVEVEVGGGEMRRTIFQDNTMSDDLRELWRVEPSEDDAEIRQVNQHRDQAKSHDSPENSDPSETGQVHIEEVASTEEDEDSDPE